MLKPRSGSQFAHGVQSVAARSFYTALWRYSKVTCPVQAHRIGRRRFGNKADENGAVMIREQEGGSTAIGSQDGGISVAKETGGSMKMKTETKKDRDGGQENDLDPIFNVDHEFYEREARKTKALEERLLRLERLLAKSDRGSEEHQVPSSYKSRQEQSKVPASANLPRTEYRKLPTEESELSRVRRVMDPRPSVATLASSGGIEFLEEVDAFRVRRLNSEKSTYTFTKSMRSVMRSVTQPVAVVTTTARRISCNADKPETSEILHELRGMTISSFTTVTLEPEPIISFNIRNPSSTLDALKDTRHFCVHFPTQTSEGRQIAQTFVKGNAKETSENPFKVEEWTLSSPPEKQQGAGVYLPMPIVGTFMSLRCEVLKSKTQHWSEAPTPFIQVGDHTIVLARVLAIEPIELNTESGRRGLGSVLCYEHGRYVATTSLESDPGAGDKPKALKVTANMRKRARKQYLKTQGEVRDSDDSQWIDSSSTVLTEDGVSTTEEVSAVNEVSATDELSETDEVPAIDGVSAVDEVPATAELSRTDEVPRVEEVSTIVKG